MTRAPHLSSRLIAPCLRDSLGCLAMLAATCCVSPATAQQLTPTTVAVQVSYPPTVVQALGREHLVYELHLTNFGADPVTLERVRVQGIRAQGADRLADGDPEDDLASSEAGDLARRLYVVGMRGPQANAGAAIPPGRRGVLYQWVTLAPGVAAPRALRHEIVFGPGGLDTLRIAPLLVSAERPLTLDPPVGAGRWAAVRGPSNDSGHRRAVVVRGGEVHIPERFAVDWVRMGEDGRLFDGDPEDNASWFGYDQPVVAVAAGTVVHVREGLPENVPLSPEVSARPFTPETVAGNTVVVRVAPGRFAVYAHLRPGSVMVREGDRVEAGQEIARIGNSGHSLAPHLHFHVEDSADLLAGEGHPFVLSTFSLLGRLDSLPQALQGAPWAPSASRPSRTVSEEILLENMVVEIR